MAYICSELRMQAILICNQDCPAIRGTEVCAGTMMAQPELGWAKAGQDARVASGREREIARESRA